MTRGASVGCRVEEKPRRSSSTRKFLQCHIQGGPAKVTPTYIFAGNVWYMNV